MRNAVKRGAGACWRLLLVVGHMLGGTVIALGVAVGRRCGWRAAWFPDVVRWWYARLCRLLGMRIRVTGEPAPNALLVANHVSWADIPVLGSQTRIDFLSKADIRDWPVIGLLSEIVGTLFIVRGANRTDSLIPQIGDRIRGGKHVVIFPEGTTTDGTRLQRFHPRLLGVGQLAGIVVQPVALRYGTNAAPDPIAPFVGDDALLPHLVRLAYRPGMQVQVQVQVRFLPPLEGTGLPRRDISDYCRRSIAEALAPETADSGSPPRRHGRSSAGTLHRTGIIML